MKPHGSERDLMKRFSRLGIGAGKTFDFAALSPAVQQAVKEGIGDVLKKEFPAAMKRVNAGEWGSPEFFGTREYLKNDYLFRFMGARLHAEAGSAEWLVEGAPHAEGGMATPGHREEQVA